MGTIMNEFRRRGRTVKIASHAPTRRLHRYAPAAAVDYGWIPIGEQARSDLVINFPFPAIVRGNDANNQEFSEETTLESLSPGLVSLALTRPVIAGVTLPIEVRLSLADDDKLPALRLGFDGVVVRTEWLGEGRWLIEVEFRYYRLIYP
jgi:hypothetical protein